jgi:DNA-cytosine methyltransferase
MNTVLRHLDLFSGIGGFSLAAKMVGGIRTEQFVEIDPYCQRVLKKNFPGVPIHDDIRTYTANFGEFDLITFGSPCQDVSFAGKGAGIKEGTRSGLFLEAIRILRVVRPRFAIMENVPGLLAGHMGIVLKEFSEIGFDVEWSVVSCVEVGGVHLRERVWVVAHSQSLSRSIASTTGIGGGRGSRDELGGKGESDRDGITPNSNGFQRKRQRLSTGQERNGLPNSCGSLGCGKTSNAMQQGLETRQRSAGEWRQRDEVKSSFRRNDDGLPGGMDRPYLMTPEDLSS